MDATMTVNALPTFSEVSGRVEDGVVRTGGV
jgi:hypothetical protein